MKSLGFAILVSAMLFGLGLSLPVCGADAPQVASEHLTLAASYEEKAAAQDVLIAEHTKMKREYKEDFFVNEKVTPVEKIRKMEDHCDAIIGAAQKEKSELLEFAKWHRMRAAELQGK